MKHDYKRILDQTIESILWHTTRRVEVRTAVGEKGKSGYQPPVVQLAVEQVVEQARRAIIAGASIPAAADGYPTTTPGNGAPGGGKNGQRMMPVPGPGGVTELVPSSSTEAAALAGPQADPVARAAGRVNAALHAVANAHERLHAEVERFTELQAVNPSSNQRVCAVAQMRGFEWAEEWEPWRTTNFAGVLAEPPFDEPRPVSKFAYWFVYNHHRLPTEDEMRQHLERGTVKVRA